MRHHSSLTVAGLLLIAACAGPPPEPSDQPPAELTDQTDLHFFVLVKSSNWAQDSAGALTLLNYHYFSELFLKDGGRIDAASLGLPGRAEPVAFEARTGNHYFEGGHFDSLEEVDAAYPNGDVVFDISTSSVELSDVTLSHAGPDGQTDIPDPITISVRQGDQEISPLEIDPARDLVVRWSEYSNGMADPRGIVDDMIFVVVADCHGERLFHTGLPFEGDYLTFRETEVVVEAGSLQAGQPYSAFVEFPHVADSTVANGVPGFTSFATATYLDLHTIGEAVDDSCPDVAPPMDTGQTDRMEPVRVP